MTTIKKGGFTLTVELDGDPDYSHQLEYIMGDIPDAGMDLSNHRDYQPHTFTMEAPVDVPEFLHWYTETYASPTPDYDNDEFEAEFKMFMRQYHWCTISMYDHGGRSLSQGASSGWDCGVAGIAFVKKSVFASSGIQNVERTDYAETREILAQRYLGTCIQDLDLYFRGECYFYLVEDSDGDEIDACYGFWGDEDYCIAEGTLALNHYLRQQAKARLDKLKTLIKNRVPLALRPNLIPPRTDYA